jgi:hypothetical protein
MRKLFLALAFLIVAASSASYAQKPASKPAATKHLKKDGTPDKRYKENKTEDKAPAGPTKKDGTPDMRYKANQTGSAKVKK